MLTVKYGQSAIMGETAMMVMAGMGEKEETVQALPMLEMVDTAASIK